MRESLRFRVSDLTDWGTLQPFNNHGLTFTWALGDFVSVEHRNFTLGSFELAQEAPQIASNSKRVHTGASRKSRLSRRCVAEEPNDTISFGRTKAMVIAESAVDQNARRRFRFLPEPAIFRC